MLLLLLLFLFLFLSPPLSFSQSGDIHSLLEFKKGIQSDPTNIITSTWSSFSSSSCPSTWHGVTCDPTNTSVISLSLSSLQLSGEIKFQTLSLLPSLQSLSLASNNLTGRLVPSLGSLQSLRHLDLSHNHFYGPVPGRIANLYSLVHLNLSSNDFNGGFPTEIRNLQQLRVLDLRSNDMWADVGALLKELRNVEVLDLSGNSFFGEVLLDNANFAGVGNTLRYLDLSGNGGVTGGFGNGVGVFRNVEVLDLGGNRFSGEVTPAFLVGMANLKVLRARDNFLFGLVPERLFDSGLQLAELDLSGNGFTGYVHTINSTSLEILNLSSNALSGPLPMNIGICRTVDLSKNKLSGDLSVIQNWGDTLEIIDLSSNSLSGNFPDKTSQFKNLLSIKLQNNSITGTLPSIIGRYPGLTTVDFSFNKLNGPILPSLLTSLTLTMLNLSGNQLTGTIPIQSSHSTESLVLLSLPLESLDLSNNLLSGSLPPEIGNLQKLKLFDVGNNNLSGELPTEITKLSELDFVDLSRNSFTGRIPDMPQTGVRAFNVSYNDLSGTVPESLTKFPTTSFFPGNALLVFPGSAPTGENNSGGGVIENRTDSKHSRSNVRVAYIVGSIGAVLLIFFIAMAVYKLRSQEICGRERYKDRIVGRDVKIGYGPPTVFRSAKNDSLQTSLSFSNDHLLTSASRSMSGQKELLTEIVEYGFSDPIEGNSEYVKVDALERGQPGHRSSTESPLSSPHLVDSRIHEQPVVFDVYSPDRLAGELFFLDSSLVFTAEKLSRAPAEVLGRSSHGTSYKATLDNGYVLTVKWLRVGLVKTKKEFAKEAKRIGTIRHPNIIPWRGYYWGPREQERLIVSDYIAGESLSLYLYESTPRRYSRLSVSQRLKIAIDIARCLHHLHLDRALPHGDLKPTNILLTGPDLTAHLTDYGLHRLLTPSGIAEQILNLGALGYRAPELAEAAKPLPSFKADIYAFGVIIMELLTRRSAGDIISGQSGAVDLTDWVQMCTREGRGTDCFDREIAGLEEAPRVMDELLAVSVKCILPVNERPNIRTVFDDLCSITM